MDSLAAKLGGIFVFGVAFAFMIAGVGVGAWLLVKLIGALRWLTLSPERRQRAKQTAAHPFAGASLRAKTAWLICCLEQALLACGLDAEQDEPGSWYPILARLWELPELPEEKVEEWLDRMSDILPSSVLSPCPAPVQPAPSLGEQERFAIAYALYHEAGPRMALLGPLVELPIRLVRENREDPRLCPEMALALLDEAQELLESYGVPGPPADNREFLLGQRSSGMGNIFVGRQCSQGFVGW